MAPAGGSVQNPTLLSGYGIGYNGEVGSSGYANGHLSLDGSAAYSARNRMLYVYATAGPMTAFGTEVGSLSPLGGDITYGYNGDGHYTAYDYPLTDTVEVRLYAGIRNGEGADQVGETIQAGTIANGFVGVVSTVPFRFVTITLVAHGTLRDGLGSVLENPYYLAVDNTRFAQPPTLPTVTVVGSSPDATAATGQPGDFVLTLSAAVATDLKVAYAIKGSATPGVDYVMLKGTAKLKAGTTSKKIKVQPLGDLGGAGKKVVKLTLQPGTGYLVGTPDPVKVKIFSGTAN